jgi:predicted RNase H-like HicB family nuclease
MRLIVTMCQDKDGVFIAECPSIPGCVSQGASEAETEANVMDAIRECLAVRAEMGLPPTVATREIDVANLMPAVPQLRSCFRPPITVRSARS